MVVVSANTHTASGETGSVDVHIYLGPYIYMREGEERERVIERDHFPYYKRVSPQWSYRVKSKNPAAAAYKCGIVHQCT